MSLLEKDKLMMQHRNTEYQRKAEQEGEKRRNLENEGLFILVSLLLFLVLFLLFIYRILLFLFLLLLSLSSWLSSIHFLRHSLLSLPAPHHLLIFFIFHSFLLLFHILQYSNTDSNEAVTCAVVTVFLFLSCSVSSLKEQLENMKKLSQNTQASSDKITQLQHQVLISHTWFSYIVVISMFWSF